MRLAKCCLLSAVLHGVLVVPAYFWVNHRAQALAEMWAAGGAVELADKQSAGMATETAELGEMAIEAPASAESAELPRSLMTTWPEVQAAPAARLLEASEENGELLHGDSLGPGPKGDLRVVAAAVGGSGKKSRNGGGRSGAGDREGQAGAGAVGMGEGGEGDGAPVALRGNVLPGYPAESRRAGEEGTVRVRFEVLASGRVGRVTLAASSGFARLDEAARNGVQGWRFEPAANGQTRQVEQQVDFALRDK
jgi:TonB family protein